MDSQYKPLSQSVNWDFQVTMQNHVTRYGRLGDKFYKQYLPAGIVLDDPHPAKEISRQMYDLAKRTAGKV
jgi:hypothetical protein